MALPEAASAPAAGLAGADSETLRRAIALVRAWRDPALPGLVFLPVLALIGCVVLVVSVLSMAGTPHVALQLPYLVSGGLGGAALIGIGAILTAVQAERRDRAAAAKEMQQVVDLVCSLTTAAMRRR